MGDTLTNFIQRKISDPALRDEILAELHWRGMDRDHGLIFEDSIEELDTPTRQPQVGSRVQLRHELSGRERFQVTSVVGDQVSVVPIRHTEDRRGWEIIPDGIEQTFPTSDLLTVVTHIEKVFPGLVSAGSVGPETDDPSHIAIRGENLHVLRALGYSHTDAVDLIYIDPPYNTGTKDWIYNDKRIDANDGFRHSKWLAFMHRRLELARDLLKDTGVIIVAIGDDEHHRLRMLMDQVFGEDNFISDVVWQGGRKNDSRHVSNGADYMVIYAKALTTWSVEGFKVKEAPDVHSLCSFEIKDRGARWRDGKPGVETVLDQGAKAWSEANGDDSHATLLMRQWFKAQPKESPVRTMSRYVYFLPDGRLCRDDNITWPGGGGPDFPVLHPVTRQPVPVPERGWLYSTPERMQQAIDGGWVIFRDDHTKNISLKKPLDTVTGQVPLSVFDRQRTHGSRHLFEPKHTTGVFREKRFPNPKDHEVLMRWIRMSSPCDAVIVDFFGGSGSTLEAVLRLNEEDGGTRQCIIATSNELGEAQEKDLSNKGFGPGDPEWEAAGVFEYVLRPRTETILTGKRPDGSTYAKALTGEHHVEFFTLDYMDDQGGLDTYIDYDLMAPLLWARAGGVGPIPKKPKPGESVIGSRFAILFDVDQISDLTDRLAGKHEVATIFIVAGSTETYRQAASDVVGRLPHKVKTIHLERTYLDSRTWIPRDRRRRAAR